MLPENQFNYLSNKLYAFLCLKVHFFIYASNHDILSVLSYISRNYKYYPLSMQKSNTNVS